ncbi:BTAD domain-containing putative transcriptional regulator [Asanoa sp. NPDC049573]|uniref:AfsR/SARP family transcriptional regulator n=1 Tax=Asanoa sp. NPDC049573 TaxID=3155396 RepID=UPI0034216CD0
MRVVAPAIAAAVPRSPVMPRFRLLGAFEVWVGSESIEVRSPKHRALLAMLLLRPGEPVPLEELLNAVWGGAQPDHPRRGVQLYVTRLRQLLATRWASELIITVPGGYRIDVGPEQVDVGRFQRYVRLAASRAEVGDLDGEAAALATALRQWGGEPLPGLQSDVLQREIAPRLREQWLQAVDRRFDVDLQLGRHEQRIGELFSLTAKNPLRESLWLRLMTALHQSGRRAEALGVFHDARRQLIDELGVEPGPELQELYAAVLFGGTRTSYGRAVAVPAAPRQLPAEVSAFVGRAVELAQLDGLLKEHNQPASPMTLGVITGTPGVGKTALANHWSRRVVDDFPDGQLWIDLMGFSAGHAITPSQALTRFLRGLDVQDAEIPPTLDEKIDLYRSVIDGRRVLIVLDNANDVGQVRPLLPGAPGCFVLVTSRRQLSGLVAAEGAHTVGLELLSPTEARQILVRRLGKERVEDQSGATEQIIKSCTRLPLALGIAAARAAARPGFALDSLAAELSNARSSLDGFRAGNYSVEVRAVFSWSYRGLTAPAARLFRLLGLHPGPDIGTSAAASLAGVPLSAARSLLTELTDANLVTEHRPDRYAFHDLLRAYATELVQRLDTPAEQRDAELRMIDHYLQMAYAGTQLVPAWESLHPPAHRPGVALDRINDHREAFEWFAREHHVLLALVQQSAADDLAKYGQQLASMLVEHLYR